MFSRPIRTFLVAAWVALLAVLGLEGAVRIWGYAEHNIYDPIYTSFDGTPDIPYVHKPNLKAARARGLSVINTDSLGLRAKSAGASYGAKRPGEYRIAIVGDSCTFGEGVPRTEDTFPQVLEAALNKQQAVTVKVFNFGASAYSVKEMTATLEYRMLDVEPDLVIMALIPQDFDLSRVPTIDSSGYFVDRRLPSRVNFTVLNILRRVHLVYVLRDLGSRWFPASHASAPPLSSGQVPESYRHLYHFKEVAAQRGLSYVVVLVPMGENAWGALPSRLARDSIRHIDLAHLNKEFTGEQFMASRFDPHPSAAVHRRIGETLADYVINVQWKERSDAASR